VENETTVANAAANPRFAVCGDGVDKFYYIDNAASNNFLRVNSDSSFTTLTGPGARIPNTVVTIDIAAKSSGVVAFTWDANPGGTNQIFWTYWNGSAFSAAHTVNTNAAGNRTGPTCISASPTANTWAIGFRDVAATQYKVGRFLDSTGAWNASAQTVVASTGTPTKAACATDGTTLYLVATDSLDTGGGDFVWITRYNDSSSTGNAQTTYGYELESGLGLSGGKTFYVLVRKEYIEGTAGIYTSAPLDQAVIVCGKQIQGFVGTGTHFHSQQQQSPCGIFVDSSVMYFLLSRLDTYDPTTLRGLASFSVLSASFSALPVFEQFSLNATLTNASCVSVLCAGGSGATYGFDQQEPKRLGSMAPPSSVFAAPSTTGGSMSDGTYLYTLIYESMSSSGDIIRSAPCTPLSVTLSGATPNGSVTIAWYGYSGTGRALLYRTAAGGSVFYLIAESIGTFGDGSIGSVLDTRSDVNISTLPELYTTGGILDNGTAPLATAFGMARNRLWAGSAEFPDRVYFTKKFASNEIPVWNEVLYLTVPAAGGAMVAIAEMDGKVILFRESAIYATFGEGPDNLGFGEFAEPQVVSRSVGCRDARSVVLTDAGLMFKSHEGIYLLTRGLGIQYAGSAVEAFNASVCSGAENLVDRHQIWLSHTDGSTLVFDEFHGIWSVWTGQPTKAFMVLASNMPAFIRSSDGWYLVESASAYSDAGTAYEPLLESGWMSLADVQGFQRMRKLTVTGSVSDTLEIKLWADFETTEFETVSVVSATVGTPYQFQIKPQRQKVEALKFRIRIPSLTASARFSAFGVEAGLKTGSMKVATSKRVGG
jgi:hypothetical protein